MHEIPTLKINIKIQIFFKYHLKFMLDYYHFDV